MKPIRNLTLLALFGLSPQSPAFAADALQEAVDTQVQANTASAVAQKNIDALSEQTRRMLDEYRDALRRSEGLVAYNAHLRKLVESQESQKQSLEEQLAEIELTRRDLVPLMLRMVEALDRFVALDRPFSLEDRTRRVQEVKDLMNRADVGDADKFRRLLEAYQAENEYGKSVDTYRGELKSDGVARTVDFLRVGRVALMYQTLDGSESGFWNHKTGQWQALPSGYDDAVRGGLALARKEAAPELLPIAVDSPEVAR